MSPLHIKLGLINIVNNFLEKNTRKFLKNYFLQDLEIILHISLNYFPPNL